MLGTVRLPHFAVSARAGMRTPGTKVRVLIPRRQKPYRMGTGELTGWVRTVGLQESDLHPRMPMPLLPARLLVSLSMTALAMLAGAAACRDDGTVTISGDVANLDSVGLLGDSLFARAGASPAMLDSLRMASGGLRVRTPSTPVADSAIAPARSPDAGTNDITARAHARGDSMARAISARLAAKPGGRSRGDTVRGVVEMINTGQARHVVLRADKGATTMSLSGMATTGLSKLVGAELMVRGVRTGPRDIVVSDYVVRAMDGVAAIDGKLASNSGGWWLEMSDGSGRRRLSTVPAALQAQEGARVWIVVGSGAAPSRTHGVIGRR